MTLLWNVLSFFSIDDDGDFLFFNFSLNCNRSCIICSFVLSKSLAYNIESKSSNQYIKLKKKKSQNFINCCWRF